MHFALACCLLASPPVVEEDYDLAVIMTHTFERPAGTFTVSMTHSGTFGGGFGVGNMHFNAVPEPSTYALLVMSSLGGLAYWRRKNLARAT